MIFSSEGRFDKSDFKNVNPGAAQPVWQASVTGLVTGVGDAVETQKEEDGDDDHDDFYDSGDV